jgi:endogenous inhibitor of DNA gyrase (YacG/DUF329 family)
LATSPKLVACPTCGKSAPYSPENRFRPFCSERCKLIDLGAWADENYRVAVKGEDPDAVASEPAPDA